MSGVVRAFRRVRGGDTGHAADRGESRRPAPNDFDRALQSERARFAAKLDEELRLACRSEATMRRELGEAARTFIGRRAYRPIGFVRLSDYARERLGVSARTLESAAWLATRLDALPAVSRAYDRSELSWTQARAICKVAVAADQEEWLAIARRSTVETLERLTTSARRPDDVPADPTGNPNEVDGEPAVRWRLICPSRVRALWRRALELASRVAGQPLPDWRAAEVVAAEGSSGRPTGASLGDRMLIEAVRLARRARREERHAEVRSARSDVVGADVAGPHVVRPDVAGPDVAAPELSIHRPPSNDSPVDVPIFAGRSSPTDSLSDPFAIEAQLAEAIRVLRTIEPRIGRLLRAVVDQRIYRSFGYPTLADYVRERLGFSARKAWALLKLEKATLRSPDLDSAYRDGRLSWVRALALLPVLDRENAAAWIERAEAVTVRRLNDEIEWVLASRDVLGPSASLAPPPIDSPLSSPVPVVTPDECHDLSPLAQLQIRADGADQVASLIPSSGGAREYQFLSPALADPAPQPNFEVCDAEIRFTGPATVVALLRDVLDAFADPPEPRWTALERLLRHVIAHWESTPRHPDPVFARDGWRCTVPACSSRRNLHDHHIRFRSRGGDNARDNRTTVCAAHHLHGIHDGTIHAFGTAPHAIEWRLGVRSNELPFMTFVGDRYCLPATSETNP